MSQQQPAVDEAELSPTQLASLRRKKNADAQAAFRSRRANYIANLEETVTRLEYVVRELQDNCRAARDEAEEMRQENSDLRSNLNSLRQAERERERVWRALNTRTNPQQSLSDASSDTDGSLIPASVSSCQQTLGGMVMHDNTHGLIDYQPRLAYPSAGELGVHQLPSPSETMNAIPGYDAYSSGQNMMMSGSSYPLFSSEHQPQTHDSQWAGSSMHGAPFMDNIEPSVAPMTCSPGSQIIIPDLAEDGTIEHSAMVRFHSSPAATTFDPSVAMLPSTPASDRGLDLSTQPASPVPQTPRRVTRSRTQLRRSQSGSDPYPTQGSSADREGRRERRRARDHSPDGPVFSDTLAVIKAQAFGTARKARTRTNRGVSEHAARVAMEVLEARGLSLGVSLDSSAERRRRRNARASESDD